MKPTARNPLKKVNRQKCAFSKPLFFVPDSKDKLIKSRVVELYFTVDWDDCTSPEIDYTWFENITCETGFVNNNVYKIPVTVTAKISAVTIKFGTQATETILTWEGGVDFTHAGVKAQKFSWTIFLKGGTAKGTPASIR